MWCRSAVNFSSFLSLAAFRTRSSACDTRSRPCVRCVLCPIAFPSAPPFAPPTPQHQKRHAQHGRSPPPCSSASQLLLRGLTSRARASSATAPRLPDADRRLYTERSNASSPGSQRQGASTHARFFDHAGTYGRSRFRTHTCSLPQRRRCRLPGFNSFAAHWLAYALPCRRFADTLAGACARLGADAVRYSFIVADFHHLLLAGFTGAPARVHQSSRQLACCVAGGDACAAASYDFAALQRFGLLFYRV